MNCVVESCLEFERIVRLYFVEHTLICFARRQGKIFGGISAHSANCHERSLWLACRLSI